MSDRSDRWERRPGASPGPPAASPWWQGLRARLLISYVAVAVTGAAVLLVTTRLLLPPLFEHRMGAGLMMGRGPGAAGPALHDALIDSLDRSLVIAVGVSLTAAVGIAVVVARRILGPIDRVRAAARRLAEGHYRERVGPPSEPELAALARDVNALAESLAETEQRRADLVSDLAHELRTPLTTIRGYTEGMVDGVVAPDRQVLVAVLGEVRRLERLAGDLSALSRIDEHAFALEVEPVDLTAVAAGVTARLAGRAADKDVSLEAPAARPVTVVGDRDRIEQVVTNLVANAVAYTPPGGRIRVDVAPAASEATLTVTDTGLGLAPDDLERVFERFYRVEGAARPPGGSGIGLAIARAIARAHDGDLTASSPGPGHGATFTLRLPVAPPAPTG